MKNIMFIVLSVLVLINCQAKHDGYIIQGNITGAADGVKVRLLEAWTYPPVAIDSTVIQNEKFVLKGKIDEEKMVKLTIDKGKPTDMLASNFYLENSIITYTGHIDSLKKFYWSDEKFRKDPVIVGSATQDIFKQYNMALSDVNHRYRAVDDKYLEVYHRPACDNIFNTEEGVKLARELNKLRKERQAIQWNFVEKNVSNVVGYDLACQFLEGMYVDLTERQIDELLVMIQQVWTDFPNKVNKFEDLAQKAKQTAVGNKYKDIELINTKGDKVKLSSFIPKGKYVLLEFWASWCSPCRGEIPHLRHVYKNYKDKGFEIVSVSIDANKADWDKAIKEEDMSWIQLCDPQTIDGPVAKVYNVMGVPACFLLDKEGRIFKTNMRGANLDAVLQELCD